MIRRKKRYNKCLGSVIYNQEELIWSLLHTQVGSEYTPCPRRPYIVLLEREEECLECCKEVCLWDMGLGIKVQG